MRHVWGRGKELLNTGRLGMSFQSLLDNGCCSHTLTSVNKGRVIFEIGGVPIREELARDGVISFLRH